MALSRKNILQLLAVSLTILILAGMIVFFVKVYAYVQSPDASAYDFITPEVALIVQADNLTAIQTLDASDKSFLRLLLAPHSYQQWQAVMRLCNELHFLKSMSSSCPIKLCLYPRESSASFLFLIEVSKSYRKEVQSLFAYLQQHHDVQSFAYKDWEVYQLKYKEHTLYYVYAQGVLLFGFDQKTIYQSLNQGKNTEKLMNAELRALESTLRSNHPLHVMVHHPVLHRYVRHKNEALVEEHLLDALSMCDWSALDIRYMDQKLILSGYVLLNKEYEGSRFYDSQAQIAIDCGLIPASSIRYMAWQGDSYDRFKHLNPLIYGTTNDLFDMMKPRSVYFFQRFTDSLCSYLAFASDDIDEAHFHLNNAITQNLVDNVFVPDTFHVGTHTIGKIDLPNFFLPVLPLTADLKRFKAYTYIAPYFIFSDKDSHLLAYLSAFKNHETLCKDARFQDFNNFCSEQAHFMYYKTLQTDSSSIHFKHLQSKARAYRLQMDTYRKNRMFFTLVIEMED
ncbi:MAG: hypothetical protein PHO77_01735 [Bacteroidales bacterium]|jgi:hypothetical protein|nr:hypothetical protein [Bacteroidales bacterium]MDD3690789.1 hypothetical protein [Bacteroidales bacterium]